MALQCRRLCPPLRLSLPPLRPSSTSLSTSAACCLRKAPKNSGMSWRVLTMKPLDLTRSVIEAFMRRRFHKSRFATMDEKLRQNIYHRSAQVYALLVWSGVGYMVYRATRPLTEEQREEQRKLRELPEEGALERYQEGSAMWWITTLKSPEEMQSAEAVKVFRFKGLSFTGSEDVTLATKEAGQAIKAKDAGGRHVGLTGREDIYLRKFHGIMMHWDGGPSPEELMAEFEAEGRNYELEMDFANRAFKVYTRYNADGTVGKVMETPDDFPTMEEVEENRKKIDRADWADSEVASLDTS